MLNNFIFFEKSAAYEKVWKNIVQPGWPYDKTTHAHFMLDT